MTEPASRPTLTVKDSVKRRKPWGDFTVNKTFSVANGKTQAGIFGVIVQTVSKTTEVTVHEETGPRTLTTTDEIAKFTSNQVTHATHSYSELFAILDGKSKESDNFQNGALLRYEKDPETGEVYADDEPPTSGTIKMVGTFAFVETTEELAREIQAKTEKQSGSIKFLDCSWSFEATTPANGLGYTTDPVTLVRPHTHTVTVTWVQDGGKTTVKSDITPPAATGGTRRRKRRARKTRRHHASL